MPNLRSVVAGALLVLVSIGCGANMAPVLDIDNQPVMLPSGYQPSLARTRDVIMRGLAAKGWTIDREEGQSIVASVTAGGHSATINITYDPSYYSIHYVNSSEGLKYDGLEIHKRYNHWIDRLRAAINQAISSSGPQEPASPAPTPAPAPVQPPPPAPDNALPPPPPPA